MKPAIIWCAKSRWEPAIRREHQLVSQAAISGVPVTFVQRPLDLRSARCVGVLPFIGGLIHPAAEPVVGPQLPQGAPDYLEVRLMERTAPLPGHLNRVTSAVDTLLLKKCISHLGRDHALLVCQSPWQWSPSPTPGMRRVFDYSDDWLALLPANRRPFIESQLRRIAEEADEIIVVSPHLRQHFPGRVAHVVPNGALASAIVPKPFVPPGTNRLVYVGTLSERFDAPVVAQVLDRLPGWRLDLYGDCQYARSGRRPDRQMAGLLESYSDRVTWHGPIHRSLVGSAIDRADVCIIPNRFQQARGQSSMKLYDFASRGRPTVASRGVADVADPRPPGYLEASCPEEWAQAIKLAATESPQLSSARVRWAANHTWERRWAAWSSAAAGLRRPMEP